MAPHGIHFTRHTGSYSWLKGPEHPVKILDTAAGEYCSAVQYWSAVHPELHFLPHIEITQVPQIP